jgi:hypothetical protein
MFGEWALNVVGIDQRTLSGRSADGQRTLSGRSASSLEYGRAVANGRSADGRVVKRARGLKCRTSIGESIEALQGEAGPPLADRLGSDPELFGDRVIGLTFSASHHHAAAQGHRSDRSSPSPALQGIAFLAGQDQRPLGSTRVGYRRIIVRISGSIDPVATLVATELDSRTIKNRHPGTIFVFKNSEPTSGFEPLTRCLQNSCSAS